MEPIEIIRQNVKLRSAYLDRSVAELCQADELDSKAISGWLAHGNPQLSSLVLIARALRIPLAALVDENFDPKDHPVLDEESVGF